MYIYMKKMNIFRRFEYENFILLCIINIYVASYVYQWKVTNIFTSKHKFENLKSKEYNNIIGTSCM